MAKAPSVKFDDWAIKNIQWPDWRGAGGEMAAALARNKQLKMQEDAQAQALKNREVELDFQRRKHAEQQQVKAHELAIKHRDRQEKDYKFKLELGKQRRQSSINLLEGLVRLDEVLDKTPGEQHEDVIGQFNRITMARAQDRFYNPDEVKPTLEAIGKNPTREGIKQLAEQSRQGLQLALTQEEQYTKQEAEVHNVSKNLGLRKSQVDAALKMRDAEVQLKQDFSSTLSSVIEAAGATGQDATSDPLSAQRMLAQLEKLKEGGLVSDEEYKAYNGAIMEGRPEGLQSVVDDVNKSIMALGSSEKFTDDQVYASSYLFNNYKAPAIVQEDIGAAREWANKTVPGGWKTVMGEAIKERTRLENLKTKRAGLTGTKVFVGPERGTLTDAQKTSLGKAQIKMQLQRVNRLVAGPDKKGAGLKDFQKFFGYMPRITRKISEVKDQLHLLDDKEAREFKRFDAIRQELGQINLEEVHELFGAAFTQTELGRQQGKIIDETMSPSQALVAMEGLYSKIRRFDAVADVLFQMQDFAKGSPEWQSEARKRYNGMLYKDLKDKGLKGEDLEAEYSMEAIGLDNEVEAGMQGYGLTPIKRKAQPSYDFSDIDDTSLESEYRKAREEGDLDRARELQLEGKRRRGQ